MKSFSNFKVNPVTSYGIILAYIQEGQEPKFLLEQKRDTYGFIDFIRGLWTTIDNVYDALSLMTKEEKERLINYSFDEIWDDIWISKYLSIYKDGKARAKRKYDSLGDIKKFIYDYEIMIGNPVKNTCSSTIREAPWGFPKGRADTGEDYIKCALREFEEETQIPASKIRVWQLGPYTETFIGHNNRLYHTVYYLAYCNELLPIKYIETNDVIRKKMVSDEVSDLKWVTYREACALINPRRQALLKKVLNEINIK